MIKTPALGRVLLWLWWVFTIRVKLLFSII